MKMRTWIGAAMALGLVSMGGSAARAEGEAAAAASGSASAEAAGANSAEGEVLSSPENSARYRKCLGEAGAERDKRKACRATRLQARAARERRIKALRRGWAQARRGVKPALAACRKLKDKEGAKAIAAWAKQGDGWVKSLAAWRQRGGTVSWSAPAAFEPCKAKEKAAAPAKTP